MKVSNYNNTNKSVDIIVFGATGYTGGFIVENLARLAKKKYGDITWGIAGRSKEKMQRLMADVDLGKNNSTGIDIKNLLIIESDIENEESLKNMTRIAKVLINCTGPNTILSPPIVKACIETGTHYVDISSEIYHILNLYRKYNKLAEDANVLVVPACGFAAIPIEAGMIHLERQFNGTLHSVDCYVQLKIPRVGAAVAHSGTWASLVHVLHTFDDYLALKADILPESSQPTPKAVERSFFFRNNGQLWWPYPGIENDTVRMSQKYLFEKSGKRPVHFNAYMTYQYCFQLIVMPALYVYYYLCRFECIKNLMINYPSIFSLRSMTVKGPTYENRQKTKFSFLLNGKGWETKDQNSEPTKSLSVKVSGRDPACDLTAFPTIMSAITIIKESSNIPKGVIMPGAAFYKTDLVNRLMDHGLQFEVLK